MRGVARVFGSNHCFSLFLLCSRTQVAFVDERKIVHERTGIISSMMNTAPITFSNSKEFSSTVSTRYAILHIPASFGYFQQSLERNLEVYIIPKNSTTCRNAFSLWCVVLFRVLQLRLDSRVTLFRP